ncbi:photosystem II stability/assembly factor HCF136, chloroplastic-like [Bidens hawaiensis]|uniref:photosystem II stability/assembly factor HCF136, chloroplastic-like n=1 Tax=Bidens hawaiensis TaxID=980011 RepID=UPI00404A411D
MVTDEGAIYVTANRGYNWKAALQETWYYTFNTVNRSPEGNYVAVSSRGNFYLTWEPGQSYLQPHNRAVARRIQNMGWRADGGLWLLVRGAVSISAKAQGSKEEAWAAGGSGFLLKTTNGGKSWSRDKATDNIAANLYSVK